MDYLRCVRRVTAGIAVCLAALLLLPAGCSRRGDLPKTVPVAGKVTYNGRPVEGATVSFIGEGQARSATAVTRADGTYKLLTLDADGAMPGRYTAVVSKIELPPELAQEVSMEEAALAANNPLPPPKKILPAKYADPGQSDLKFEVKEGETNNFDLVLTD